MRDPRPRLLLSCEKTANDNIPYSGLATLAVLAGQDCAVASGEQKGCSRSGQPAPSLWRRPAARLPIPVHLISQAHWRLTLCASAAAASNTRSRSAPTLARRSDCNALMLRIVVRLQDRRMEHHVLHRHRSASSPLDLTTPTPPAMVTLANDPHGVPLLRPVSGRTSRRRGHWPMVLAPRPAGPQTPPLHARPAAITARSRPMRSRPAGQLLAPASSRKPRSAMRSGAARRPLRAAPDGRPAKQCQE
jgi:hypothetical protein